jgi:hypothetical protein
MSRNLINQGKRIQQRLTCLVPHSLAPICWHCLRGRKEERESERESERGGDRERQSETEQQNVSRWLYLSSNLGRCLDAFSDATHILLTFCSHRIIEWFPITQDIFSVSASNHISFINTSVASPSFHLPRRIHHNESTPTEGCYCWNLSHQQHSGY